MALTLPELIVAVPSVKVLAATLTTSVINPELIVIVPSVMVGATNKPLVLILTTLESDPLYKVA